MSRRTLRMLTDEQWARIAPHLPPHPPSPKGGRPRATDRDCLEGLLWLLRTGARWRDLPKMYAEAAQAIQAVDGTLAASAHLSHSYPDGACLYFTFAGQIEPDRRESYYRAAWDAGTRAVLAAGGALSHHHGVGLNRARFVREALGEAFDVLAAVKATLDPRGILNPGKLALPDPFGDVGWP